MNFEKIQEAINPNVIPKSKFTGVSWDGEKKKWIARLSYNKKAYYAGRFDSEIEAAKAVNAKCMSIGIVPKNLGLMPGWGKEVTSVYQKEIVFDDVYQYQASRNNPPPPRLQGPDTRLFRGAY